MMLYAALGVFLFFSIINNSQAQTVVTQNRNLTRFYGIFSTGPFVVTVNFGQKEAVIVEADPAIIPFVETTVRYPLMLNIRFSDNFSGTIKYQGIIKVSVTAKALTTLSVAGSGPVTLNSPLQSNDLQVEISGSGDVTAPLLVNNANILLSGSGNFVSSGKIKNANINLSGSGSFKGPNLVAQQANIAIYASGNAAIYCESYMSVWITGSGSVQYGGNPTINQQITGSGFITKAL